MKKIELNNVDRTTIQQFFETAKQEHGGIDRLFATPLSFSDEEGVVKFRFPKWMEGIRQYLATQYGFNNAGRLMLDLMSEWIADGSFRLIPNLESETVDLDEKTYNKLASKQNISY